MSRDPIEAVDRRCAPYGYVCNMPGLRVDPSGLLGPCTSHPVYPCNSLPCVGNTNGYAGGAKGGDPLASCASCVSAALCDAICFCTIETIPLFPPNPACCYVLGPLQCQNNCMYGYWKAQSLPEWKRAHRVCQKNGLRSYACCAAEVHAEQTGYTLCAQKCDAGLGQVPQSAREAFARKLCCSGLPGAPQSVSAGATLLLGYKLFADTAPRGW